MYRCTDLELPAPVHQKSLSRLVIPLSTYTHIIYIYSNIALSRAPKS